MDWLKEFEDHIAAAVAAKLAPKFDGLIAKVEAAVAKVEGLRSDVSRLATKLDALSSKIDHIGTPIDPAQLQRVVTLTSQLHARAGTLKAAVAAQSTP